MELLENLAEFLKIDIKQENSVDSVFLVTLKYLDKLKARDFEYELLIPLRGILNKFANSANYHGVENIELTLAADDFINTVNQTTYRPVEPEGGFIDFFGKNNKKNIITKTNAPIYQKFQTLYNALIATYNLVKDGQPKSRDLDLEGFYNPNHANKNKARQLLVIAKEQIERNIALTEKPKKTLAEFLTKTILELDKPNSDWTVIFGRLKEVVTVLHALESLANGITGMSTLIIACEKIEEAIAIVDQTSININYKTMNHIFNIQEGTLLIDSPNPTLQIESIEEMPNQPLTTIIETETTHPVTEVQKEKTAESITIEPTETETSSKAEVPKPKIAETQKTIEPEPEIDVEAENVKAKTKATATTTTKPTTKKAASKTKTAKPKATRTRKKKTDEPKK